MLVRRVPPALKAVKTMGLKPAPVVKNVRGGNGPLVSIVRRQMGKPIRKAAPAENLVNTHTRGIMLLAAIRKAELALARLPMMAKAVIRNLAQVEKSG